MPCGPGLAPATLADGRPSILQILRKRSAWGTFLGLFCNAYSLYFLIAWLPYYLVRERHFSMDAMAKIGGAVYLTQAVFSFACGQFSDRWIALGASRTRVHITFMTVGLLGTAGFLLLCAVAVPRLAMVMLLLTGASCGLTMASTWPITQTVAGPAASGRWTGLQCAFGNSSGALASALTGLILDRTGQFLWAFVVAAAFCVVGVFTWIGLVCPVEPIIWE
jgi:MFS transporter, ACS family, D-galactonate transporter